MKIVQTSSANRIPDFGDLIITSYGFKYLVVNGVFGGIFETKTNVLLVDLSDYSILYEFESKEELREGQVIKHLGQIHRVIPSNRLTLSIQETEPIEDVEEDAEKRQLIKKQQKEDMIRQKEIRQAAHEAKVIAEIHEASKDK